MWFTGSLCTQQSDGHLKQGGVLHFKTDNFKTNTNTCTRTHTQEEVQTNTLNKYTNTVLQAFFLNEIDLLHWYFIELIISGPKQTSWNHNREKSWPPFSSIKLNETITSSCNWLFWTSLYLQHVHVAVPTHPSTFALVPSLHRFISSTHHGICLISHHHQRFILLMNNSYTTWGQTSL